MCAIKQWNNRLLSVLSADWRKVFGKCGGNTRYCRGFSWLVYTALLTSFCLPAYAQLTIEDFAYIQRPIAIDFDPYSPGGRFIVSHFQNNPRSFSQVSRNTGTVSPFAHISNMSGAEFYHIVLHHSWGPYGAGWVLSPAWQTSGSVLWAIDPNGNASPVPTSGQVPSSLNNHTKLRYDPVRDVLYFQNETDNTIYKVSWDSSTATARFEVLAQNISRPEGGAVLRSNPRYGPWSGKLVSLQNGGSTIYAIDPDTGDYTTWDLGISDLEVIYPLVVNADPIAYPSELYIAVYGQNKIIRVRGLLEMGVLPGDLLIANEHPGQVWWDGSQFQKRLLLQTGHIEDMIAIPEPGSLSVMAAGLLLLSARLSGGKRLLRRGCRS
jgi:hypothetical protein